MNIEMTEQKCYSFKIGEKQIDGMRRVSEWNGMTELCGADGQKLIVRFDESLAGRFSALLGCEPIRNADIVCGSPDLLAFLKESAPEAFLDAQSNKAAGMEAAAKVVEGGAFLHAESPQALWAKEVAAAIRAEMAKLIKRNP